MPRGSQVEAVVRSASHRRVLVILVEQLGGALALVLAGSVLMLLLGTQILDWYWLVLLAVMGIAFASFQTRSRRLTPYRVAQLLDRRLQLSDSLSTAWFLLFEARRFDDPVARYQIMQADRMASSVQSRRAFPFSGHRAWGLAGALAAVVFGLFAVRYLVTSSLSLRQALIPIQLASVFERVEKSLFAENHPLRHQAAEDGGSAGQLASPQDSNVPDDALQQQDQKGQPDGASARRGTSRESDRSPNHSQQSGKSESRDGAQANSQPNGGEKSEEPSANQPSSQRAPNTKEQTANNQQGSSGFIDKMKDALSGLMAKMRSNDASRKSLQNNEQPNEDQKSGDQASASKDQQGQQNARNEQSSQQQSSEGQAQGQTMEKAQAAQGRNSDMSPQKGSDAHSGVGRQDGDKDLREAEQLRAMGKLAEIIGKRSASVTGDITVETPSGKQQLKTAYSQRLGHHLDLGGEINRDEIPLADQQYVKDYMEQVRKQSKPQP